jgi:hypothetical protein
MAIVIVRRNSPADHREARVLSLTDSLVGIARISEDHAGEHLLHSKRII